MVKNVLENFVDKIIGHYNLTETEKLLDFPFDILNLGSQFLTVFSLGFSMGVFSFLLVEKKTTIFSIKNNCYLLII